MLRKTLLSGLLSSFIAPACFALSGIDASKTTVKAVGVGDIATWGLALLVVLSVFMLCIWGIGRLNGLHINNAEKMRVVGGLSLGLREKVMLLQVGKKQLILAVTPGRIETLHVLEGDDCLLREDNPPTANGAGFAQKLMQAMKARTDG
ncbi:MAG: flagellar biosynthetic protein FliO [Methylovulum sp.]|nr:flagellar biosynthetic protein FliO [Methylovulum sp.]